MTRKKVATIISFHALGWLAGIAAAGIVNDEKLIFLVSSAFFVVGLLVTIKLPNITSKKELEPGTTKRIISKNRFLFLSLLMRHIGASAVWMILPIMLMDVLGAKLYEISIVYVANTVTAFVIMNLMAGKIKIRNVTKFKIGYWINRICICRIVLHYRVVDGYAFHGISLVPHGPSYS